jgi:hypothetical protein
MGRQVYDDDQLLELLRAARAKLGRVPSMRDLDRDPDFPASFTYKSRFKTYSQALKLALGPGTAVRAPARKADDRRLRRELRALAKRLGRAPSVSELNAAPGMYHANTYIRHYGSWSQAVREILGS